MYIIGHVGPSAGVKLSSKQQSTHIGTSANPSESIRQFNNVQRGTRQAVICVCIYVPAWRRLAVRELVQLWHRSRKLACRMRFGITMAYDLGLPCFVSPLALLGDAARRALPHIVARLETEQDNPSAATPPPPPSVANDERDDAGSGGGGRKWRSARLRRTSSTSSRGSGNSRRRGRRPSEYETLVTEHVMFGDLSADAVARTVAPIVDALATPSATEQALDRLNTMTYNGIDICFTVGKHGDVARRTAEAAKRTSRSKPAKRAPAASAVVANTDVDEVDEDEDEADDDDGSAPEDAEEAEDSEGGVARVRARSAPPRAKRKRLDVADDEAALAPLRRRNLQEIAAYQRTTTTPEASTTSTATTPALSAVSDVVTPAAERVARECVVDGAFDNRALVERADDCFTEANEYIARPLKRVRIERAQRCVCGVRDSFVDSVCRECRRTALSVRVVRTNVVALREQATHERCSPHDRREISRLVVHAERETPIDDYIRATAEQLREALTQQQQQHGAFRTKTAPPSPRRASAPKEMRFISAVLTPLSIAK